MIEKIVEKLEGLNPLLLAIIIDVTMLLPFDIILTGPLQYILWKKIGRNDLMMLNIGYSATDLLALGLPVDAFPLNTVCILYLKIKGDLKWD
jgi:hypothetical protein